MTRGRSTESAAHGTFVAGGMGTRELRLLWALLVVATGVGAACNDKSSQMGTAPSTVTPPPRPPDDRPSNAVPVGGAGGCTLPPVVAVDDAGTADEDGGAADALGSGCEVKAVSTTAVCKRLRGCAHEPDPWGVAPASDPAACPPLDPCPIELGVEITCGSMAFGDASLAASKGAGFVGIPQTDGLHVFRLDADSQAAVAIPELWGSGVFVGTDPKGAFAIFAPGDGDLSVYRQRGGTWTPDDFDLKGDLLDARFAPNETLDALTLVPSAFPGSSAAHDPRELRLYAGTAASGLTTTTVYDALLSPVVALSPDPERVVYAAGDFVYLWRRGSGATALGEVDFGWPTGVSIAQGAGVDGSDLVTAYTWTDVTMLSAGATPTKAFHSCGEGCDQEHPPSILAQSVVATGNTSWLVVVTGDVPCGQPALTTAKGVHLVPLGGEPYEIVLERERAIARMIAVENGEGRIALLTDEWSPLSGRPRRIEYLVIRTTGLPR